MVLAGVLARLAPLPPPRGVPQGHGTPGGGAAAEPGAAGVLRPRQTAGPRATSALASMPSPACPTPANDPLQASSIIRRWHGVAGGRRGAGMRATGEGEDVDGRDRERRALADERESLRAQLFDLLDPALTALGLVVAALLVAEFAADLTPRQAAWVDRAQLAIWALFTVEFAVQFALAPRKLAFLRGHWLAALAVVLPAFRAFRLVRAARALRSLRLVRLLGGTNRAMRALRAMLRGRQFGYLVALTLLVVALGAAGIRALERGQPGATIHTLGDALWWAACLVTTINSEKYAVSPEGRVLAVLLRVYAAAIFGLLTANIASYLVGRRQAEQADEPEGGKQATGALLEEVRQLRAELRARRPDGEGNG